MNPARNSLTPAADAPLVLIADDDEMIRALLRTRLELSGFRTVAVRDGVDALEVVASRRPAAMILDIAMPRLDGFGVLESLGRGGRAIPPTLVLAASRATADVQRAIRLGAKDFMVKPFDDQTLLRRVERLVRRPAPPAVVSAPQAPPPAAPAPSPSPSPSEVDENELYL